MIRCVAAQQSSSIWFSGLDNGILANVPDPEKEEGQQVSIIRLDVVESKSLQDARTHSKRKADGCGNNGSTPYRKKEKIAVTAADLILTGCKWDHSNYSCTYDSAISPIVHLINEDSNLSHHSHAVSSMLLSYIQGQLSELQNCNDMLTQSHLHNMRHFLRSRLFDRSPTLFPWGKSFAAIED